MILDQWAKDHNISLDAIADLRSRMGIETTRDTLSPISEAAAQQHIRLAESKAGNRLWRNNVGVDTAEGRYVRYGLSNDSKQLNARIKSSDLIGITPVTVGPVTLGVFTSIEVKRPGWRFSGTGRESAQLAWLDLVMSLGGIAKFSTGEEYK